MLKSINKIFSPSSSSSQDANAWIKSLAIVVIDEQQAIQCGGSIITTIMIVIPTGCWPNTLPSYSALVQHRLPEGGVKAYKLSSIVKTIPPAREVDIVQVSNFAEKSGYSLIFENRISCTLILNFKNLHDKYLKFRRIIFSTI